MMRGVALPGSLCGVLAAVIAWQLAADLETSGRAVVSPGTRLDIAESASPAAAPDYAAALQIIESRPLFSPDRRPVQRTLISRPVAAHVKPFARKLTGVVLDGNLRAAFFAGEDGKRSVMVRQGEPIEGWFLESVTSSGVELRTAGASQRLELNRTKQTDGKTTAKPVIPSFISPALAQNR